VITTWKSNRTYWLRRKSTSYKLFQGVQVFAKKYHCVVNYSKMNSIKWNGKRAINNLIFKIRKKVWTKSLTGSVLGKINDFNLSITKLKYNNSQVGWDSVHKFGCGTWDRVHYRVHNRVIIYNWDHYKFIN
jgi:hypothetical protein